MDVLDRDDWQMDDHDTYNTPVDWPENVFFEDLAVDGDEPATSDDPAVGAADDSDDDDDVKDEPAEDEDDDEPAV